MYGHILLLIALHQYFSANVFQIHNFRQRKKDILHGLYSKQASPPQELKFTWAQVAKKSLVTKSYICILTATLLASLFYKLY